MKNKYKLTIGWLYPDLMSTYGDRGNIIVLQKRCEWRGIEARVEKISINSRVELVRKSGILFMGGAQDVQQEIVNKDLEKRKGNTLKEMIEKDIPGLFVCGAYQALGNEYIAQDKTKIKGLGIFDLITRHPGGIDNRLVGNIVIKPNNKLLSNSIVGFENHGGRTTLGEGVKPFAKVKKGFGNNGEDKTEGAVYKNAIGTYLHGPILSKNPELADFLIQTALEIKYKSKFQLKSLDDSIEKNAKDLLMKREVR